MNEKIEKHLKPHQLALQQKYTDARTQMPVQNMSYKDKAPFISLIGPRDSGKDKLFDLLVTTLTKKSNIQIDNIITVANSQNKITLYKSQDKLSSYIDAVKISDLVILSIDANNIKIDTFEIISLLKAHGMCKVIVAVDNADRKNLKVVKKRVWKEITPGIKIYNIDIKSDIEKMAREIKNMKFRPLQFRCNNSYVIADKIQYEAENDKYNYYFYGYVRGCPLRTNNIHIPGNGDYEIAEKEILDDPCSILTKKLLEKEKRNFYAPKYKEQITVSDIIENDVQEEESSEEFALCNDAKIVMKQEASEENKKEESRDPIAESRETMQETSQESLDDLLNIIADKFEAKAETEEDYIEKFNEQTKDKVEITKRDERLQQEKKNNDLVSDFVPGQYVKITLKGIDELVIGNLAILGAINFTTKTVLQGRVKKLNHFIHSLKSNEKYLISLGWRRDVCVDIFSYKDPTRNKFLKYILDDAHCNINFESNVIDPGTTFCIIKENQMIKDEKHNNYRATDNLFRIAAQGTITDASGKTNLVKKLKLIGYPLKIDEHTVFVKDMFSSDKEVAKFEGAMLKTVGGIRGSVKKSLGHNGDFRATFEGRLLMSDIIMLKCYVPYTYQDHEQTTAESKKKKIITSAKNVAEMIEKKKDRKHAYKVKQIEKNLTIDKKKIVDDFAMPQIPIDSAQKNYSKLKDKIKDKRLALEEREIKKLKLEAERLEKERTQHDKEKKEKLKKTIIEKNLFKPGKPAHKQHKKKSKRRK